MGQQSANFRSAYMCVVATSNHSNDTDSTALGQSRTIGLTWWIYEPL
jgi:hypothetical protein